jgi:hypothetical protein
VSAVIKAWKRSTFEATARHRRRMMNREVVPQVNRAAEYSRQTQTVKKILPQHCCSPIAHLIRERQTRSDSRITHQRPYHGSRCVSTTPRSTLERLKSLSDANDFSDPRNRLPTFARSKAVCIECISAGTSRERQEEFRSMRTPEIKSRSSHRRSSPFPRNRGGR